MRISELSRNYRKFSASVRVKCGNTSTVVKTTMEAQSRSQARTLLCHIYGTNNVLSVSEIVLETPRTNQIERRATVNDKTAQTSTRQPTNGPTLLSHVSETDTAPKPSNPSEQRVKSLNDQAKRLKQQAKQIKAQDAVKKAQTQLNKAKAPSQPSANGAVTSASI